MALALLNVGLPGSNVADGTLLLSLMRSARISDYPFSAVTTGSSSDLGLELGQERTFHYALVPHLVAGRTPEYSRLDSNWITRFGTPPRTASREASEELGPSRCFSTQCGCKCSDAR